MSYERDRKGRGGWARGSLRGAGRLISARGVEKAEREGRRGYRVEWGRRAVLRVGRAAAGLVVLRPEPMQRQVGLHVLSRLDAAWVVLAGAERRLPGLLEHEAVEVARRVRGGGGEGHPQAASCSDEDGGHLSRVQAEPAITFLREGPPASGGPSVPLFCIRNG